MKIVEQSVVTESSTPDALKVIEKAARTCYASLDKITEDSAEDFVRKLITRGHEAVLEMADISFRIRTDRGVMAEATRHRMSSFCVESTRYVKYDDTVEVIKPSELSDKLLPSWVQGVENSIDLYKALIASGEKPQTARSVLPNCIATTIVYKTNFRSLRNFLKLRLASGAHPEIRTIAKIILEIMRKECPVIVEDLEIK